MAWHSYSKALVLGSYSGCFPAMGRKKSLYSHRVFPHFAANMYWALWTLYQTWGALLQIAGVCVGCWRRIVDSSVYETWYYIHLRCESAQFGTYVSALQRNFLLSSSGNGNDGLLLLFPITDRVEFYVFGRNRCGQSVHWLRSRNRGFIPGNAKRFFSPHWCP
jgi:hypothetical protein